MDVCVCHIDVLEVVIYTNVCVRVRVCVIVEQHGENDVSLHQQSVISHSAAVTQKKMLS